MGTASPRCHAGGMTTSTLATRATAPRVDSAVGVPRRAVATDRVPQLALVAPLLLFAHGILVWVDGIGNPNPAETRASAVAVVAGGIHVLALAGFASLAGVLVARDARSRLASPVTLL